MQDRLSLGFMMQMGLQILLVLMTWIDVATFPLYVYHQSAGRNSVLFVNIYDLVRTTFLQWLPAISGLIIRWSIAGLFQKGEPQRNVAPVILTQTI
ncbi:hypothetical protein Y032_0701g1647 [Ancylostoma ceylanicum]|uniref:Uncharacterized protein n=1 Tax=Ancylostoma ceylanicum TaxID=53326 RepID=A0A016WFU5_9BILA|nr:hypothetical protein Y032_0701g1647 [Ancylostoma ceylanicum]